MKLKDLLDELRHNILNDRSNRVSGDSDYLWTDRTLVNYINEAQRRFAARSLILRDGSTPEVTRVTLATGVDTYTLHPSIIAVLSAKMPNTRRDLARIGHTLFGDPGIAAGGWDVGGDQLPDGVPLAFSTDEEIATGDDDSRVSVSLRVHPAPDAVRAGQVIQLRVVRKPIEDLVFNNLEASPEIPVDHHIEMLDWAAYLALRIIDHDTGDAPRAQEFANSFETHVQNARKLVMRKLFAPKAWGFGRGGWSWGA